MLLRKPLLSLLALFLILPPALISNVSTIYSQEKVEQKSRIDTDALYFPNEVLVKYKNEVNEESGFSRQNLTDLKDYTKVSSNVLNLRFDESSEGFSRQVIEKVSTEWGEIDAFLNSKIEEIKQDPNVEIAQPNFMYKSDYTPSDPLFSNQWNIPASHIDDAWDLEEGSEEMVIAIIDTGVDYNHPDLKNKMLGDCTNGCPEGTGYDFVNLPFNPGGDQNEDFFGADNNPMDLQGHGTHVAGIAAAETNNGIGISGSCVNCKIMPIRSGYKDPSGAGALRSSEIIQGINYAVNYNADIVNMSFGGYGADQLAEESIQAGADQGIIFFASAGNSSSFVEHYPAAYETVIGVASIDSNLQKSPYSNYGNWIDVAAGGDYIPSTIPLSHGGSGYQYYSGTSQASPLVAGVGALIKSQNPTYNYNQVKTILMQSSTILPALQETSKSGGYVNALASIQFDNQTVPKFQNEETVFEEVPAGGSYTEEAIVLFTNSYSGEVTLTLDSENFEIVSPGNTFVVEPSSSVEIVIKASSDTVGTFSDTLYAQLGSDTVSTELVGTFSSEVNINIDVEQNITYTPYENEGIVEIPFNLETSVDEYDFNAYSYEITFNENDLQFIQTDQVATNEPSVRAFYQTYRTIDSDENGNITIRVFGHAINGGYYINATGGYFFSVVFKAIQEAETNVSFSNFTFGKKTSEDPAKINYVSKLNNQISTNTQVIITDEIVDSNFEEQFIDLETDYYGTVNVTDFNNDGLDEIVRYDSKYIYIEKNLGGQFETLKFPHNISLSGSVRPQIINNADGTKSLSILTSGGFSNTIELTLYIFDINNNFELTSSIYKTYSYSMQNVQLLFSNIALDLNEDGVEEIAVMFRDVRQGQNKVVMDTFKYNNITNSIDRIDNIYTQTNLTDITGYYYDTGDIDGDGDLEILVSKSSNEDIYLIDTTWANNRVEISNSIVDVDLPIDANSYSSISNIRLIDVNGDGLDDLSYAASKFDYTTGKSFYYATIHISTNGTFSSVPDYALEQETIMDIFGADIDGVAGEEVIMNTMSDYEITGGDYPIPNFKFKHFPSYILDLESGKSEIIKSREFNGSSRESILPIRFNSDDAIDLLAFSIHPQWSENPSLGYFKVHSSILINKNVEHVNIPISLISPENNFSTTSIPEFSWEEVEGVDNYTLFFESENKNFNFEISSENCSEGICKFTPEFTEEIIDELEVSHSYLWYVESELQNGIAVSEQRTIVFTKPSGPTIISPESESTFWDIDFEWEHIQGATEYKFELFNEDSIPELIYENIFSAEVYCVETCKIVSSQNDPYTYYNLINLINQNLDSNYNIKITAMSGDWDFSSFSEKEFRVNSYQVRDIELVSPNMEDDGTWYTYNRMYQPIKWVAIPDVDLYVVDLYDKTFGYYELKNSYAISPNDCVDYCTAYGTMIRDNGNYELRIKPYSRTYGYSKNGLKVDLNSKYMSGGYIEMINSGVRVNPDDVEFSWKHKEGLTSYDIEIQLQATPAYPSGKLITKTVDVDDSICTGEVDSKVCKLILKTTDMYVGNHKARIKGERNSGIHNLEYTQEFTPWKDFTYNSYILPQGLNNKDTRLFGGMIIPSSKYFTRSMQDMYIKYLVPLRLF